MSALTKKSDTHREHYVHLAIKNHPRVKNATVFAREYEPGAWGYTVAFCHVTDQFDRRIGRQIARRTYFRDGARRWHVDGPFEFQKAVDLAMRLANELTGQK